MANANAQEKKETVSFGDIVVEFIRKNRKILVAVVIACAAVLIGIVAGLSIRERVVSREISRAEALGERFEELRFDINEPESEEDVQALLADLDALASKSGAFASARSYSLIADIHADRKNWAEAEKAWILAAQKGGKGYLAPVSWFNAAVAAEEAGDIDGAIAHYGEALAFADSFPGASKAQFAIGRLEEGRGNREAALEAYRALIEKWPLDTIWANLANTRIIALTGLSS
ncbi:MAG: tetratricopeptide repeat protein [Treponema sp.]|jgi:tetratricopeptide (TPR) repeat protein|nr:tetratricopeptide repeat protein [Treponema sp.]